MSWVGAKLMSDGIQPGSLTHLLIVIVNYQTATLTINCLRSLETEVQSLPDTRVVVVDNASNDGSVEQISTAIKNEGWGNWVSLLPQGHNGGYSFGNNAALRPALQSAHPPAYFLLLNPDTVVRLGAVKILVDFMEQHSNVGMAGNSRETLDGVPIGGPAFRFHTVLSELDAGLRLGVVSKLLSNWVISRPLPEEPCQTDWMSGACLIIRREVFDSIGLLDEGYFLYYEETDFCLRAYRAGWSCWYVPQSRIVHFCGQSTGVTGSGSSRRRPQYWFESRQRYFVKNYGWLYAALADLVWIFGFALWRLRRVIQRKPDNEPPKLLSDFLMNSVFLKSPVRFIKR